MKADIEFLTNLFYPSWTPPEAAKVRRHRIMHEVNRPTKEKSQPVHARTKLMAALDEFEWKTNDELAKETCLNISTVAITTDRMYNSGKIQRTKKKMPHGYVNMYRKK